ncbi:MAG: hypothetical protein ACRDE8_14245, partial [Ginsengibacter sp.]
MAWVALFVGLFGGGIIADFINQIRKRGKIELNEFNAKLFYREFQLHNFISTFSLDLQFINSSGHQEIIKDIKARFYTGANFIPLQFENFNTKPADI